MQAAGGQVIYAGCWRVQGDLAVSRAFGDAHLKPYGVSSTPELSAIRWPPRPACPPPRGCPPPPSLGLPSPLTPADHLGSRPLSVSRRAMLTSYSPPTAYGTWWMSSSAPPPSYAPPTRSAPLARSATSPPHGARWTTSPSSSSPYETVGGTRAPREMRRRAASGGGERRRRAAAASGGEHTCGRHARSRTGARAHPPTLTEDLTRTHVTRPCRRWARRTPPETRLPARRNSGSGCMSSQSSRHLVPGAHDSVYHAALYLPYCHQSGRLVRHWRAIP